MTMNWSRSFTSDVTDNYCNEEYLLFFVLLLTYCIRYCRFHCGFFSVYYLKIGSKHASKKIYIKNLAREFRLEDKLQHVTKSFSLCFYSKFIN